MGMISDNLKQVNAQIEAACAEFGRASGSVHLLAVSKTFGPEAVREAYSTGQRAFGENYIQEGVEKTLMLQDLPGIEWHMVGPIQSNKTRLVAQHFDWAHSIDRLKIAQRLSEQRPPELAALQVCLQVNVDGGANKAGCTVLEAAALAREISRLPRLQLRGVMVIPEPAPDFVAIHEVFARTRGLFDQISQDLDQFDTLSMGMSADLRAAVSAGSTMVRVGTAIFGSRRA